jgi:hypothetical protein
LIDVSTPRQVNSVSLTAPSAGFLLVDGHVFVNNEQLGGSYLLSPKLDGAFIMAQQWAAEEDGTAGQLNHFTLDYSLSVAVGAGAHTITQELSGPGGGNSFYNANNLNVVFMPQGGVSGGSAQLEGASATHDGD